MFKNVFLILLALSIYGCSDEDRVKDVKTKHSSEFQSTWNENISDVIADPLWHADYAYDASTSLMLPMHYAFSHRERFEDDPTIEFDLFFNLLELEFIPENIENRVTRTQFLYFITQYLKLNHTRILKNDFMLRLFYKVEQSLIDMWFEEQAVHWDKKLDFKGIKQRLNWKLETAETEKAFYRAVIDEEWASLVALSDLIYISRQIGVPLSFNETEIVNTGERLIQEFGIYIDEEFYFQKGVWFDHPDYIYAGNEEIYPDITPFPVFDIAIDSSHSHRLPLWLTSLEDVAINKSLFQQAKHGLKATFEKRVFQSVYEAGETLFLQTNFMDGTNGVYRYSYDTQGEGNGYQAYELSGTLFVGYYAFLDSKVYSESMRQTRSLFPLSDTALQYYIGPNTTRNRHVKFRWPDYFNNGFALLFAGVVGCYNAPFPECEAN